MLPVDSGKMVFGAELTLFLQMDGGMSCLQR